MRFLRPLYVVRAPVAGVLLAFTIALVCSACGSSGGSTATATPSGASSSRTSSSTPAGTGTSTATGTGTGTGTGTQGTGTTSTPTLPGTGRPTVTIGDKNYTEQFVLGQLYLQALQADGFTVNVNPNIGPTEVTVQALRTGSLALYPEYLDVFNSAIAGYKHSFASQFDAYQAAQHFALANGLQLLAPTPFSDTDAIAVTVAYAAANQLKSISDLHRVSGSLSIGGPPQFQQGPPGLPELRDVYGIIPAAFQPLAVGDQYSALDDATIQAADVNTTDGQLASGDYSLLRDPMRIFGWGNVVPVVSAKVLAAEGPAFAATIERVDAALSTAVMRQLNEEVDVAKLDPAAVAKRFLQTHGLLSATTS